MGWRDRIGQAWDWLPINAAFNATFGVEEAAKGGAVVAYDAAKERLSSPLLGMPGQYKAAPSPAEERDRQIELAAAKERIRRGYTQTTEALEPLSWAYENLVDKPLGTVLTAGSLVTSDTYLQAQGQSSTAALFSGQTWKDAYAFREQKDLTLGGALANTFTDDLLDQAEYDKFHKGFFYKAISLPTDLTAMFRREPLLLPAKGLQALRVKQLKPVRPGDDFDKMAQSRNTMQAVKQSAQWAKEDPTTAAAKIRERFFADNVAGADLSTIMAQAADNDVRTLIMRTAYGDLNSLNTLQVRDLAASQVVRRAMGDKAALHAIGMSDEPVDALGQPFLFNAVEEHAKLGQEMTEAMAAEQRLARVEWIQGSLRNQPSVSPYAKAKFEIIRSETYQGKYGTPVRVNFQLRDHGKIDLDSTSGDVQLDRFLRHSPLDQKRRDQLRSAFMATRNVEDKQLVVGIARDQALIAVMKENGLAADDVARVLARAKQGFAEQEARWASREFDGATIAGEGGVITKTPIHSSQLNQTMTLPDLMLVRKLAKRMGPNSAKRAALGDDVADNIDLLTDAVWQVAAGYTRAWKPATLFRPAYILRTQIDQQLRMLAMFGVQARMQYVRTAPGRMVANHRMKDLSLTTHVAQTEEHLGRKLSAAERKRAKKQAFYEYNAHDKILGPQEMQVGGINVPAPMQGRFSRYKHEADTASSFDLTMHADITRQMASLSRDMKGYETTGSFKIAEWTKDPKEQLEWTNGWLRAVNHQISSDPVMQMLLKQHLEIEGVLKTVRARTVKDPVSREKNFADIYGEANVPILDWLFSPAGASYRLGMPQGHMQTPETIRAWIATKRGQIESYLPTAELKVAAMKGKASPLLAEREFGKLGEGSRPTVHADELEEFAPNPLSKLANKAVEVGYNMVARQPTNVLAAHPTFIHSYYLESSRRIKMIGEQRPRTPDGKYDVTQAEMDRITAASHEVALKDLKRNMYDLRDEADIGHYVRFMMPFYNAWREAWSVWGRLSLNNPTVPVRLWDLWQAPDRIGNTYTDPNNGQEFLTLPIPSFLRSDKVFAGALKFPAKFRVSKHTLNVLMTTAPGMGPLGQMPTAQFLKSRPELAENGLLEFVYGGYVPQSVLESLTPTVIKNFVKAREDEDGKTFLSYFNSIYMNQLWEVQQGLRDPKDMSVSDITEQAHGLANFRLYAQLFSPGSLTFESPLQPYLDMRAKMMRDDPDSGEQNFLREYGEELAFIGTAMSKSNNGVPPTVEAYRASKEFADLIAAHPEQGALIIGALGGELAQGQFNAHIYAAQMRDRIGGETENANLPQRERLDTKALLANPQIEVGWREYETMATSLDNTLEQRGLRNYRQRGAEDLAAIKKALLDPENPASIAARYPLWYDSYTQPDRDKWREKVNAFDEWVWDDRFDDRDDIVGLREYLTIRRQVASALTSREVSSLDSMKNADIAEVWEAATADIVLRNPAFARVYHRMLERDPVVQR